jgi:hypothetical protein
MVVFFTVVSSIGFAGFAVAGKSLNLILDFTGEVASPESSGTGERFNAFVCVPFGSGVAPLEVGAGNWPTTGLPPLADRAFDLFGFFIDQSFRKSALFSVFFCPQYRRDIQAVFSETIITYRNEMSRVF